MESTARKWMAAPIAALFALVLAAAVGLVAPGSAYAAGASITQQPQDVEVVYPAGATFLVEVDNPDIVLSYQWMAYDSVGKPFILDGTSASTDTLIIPSTERTWSDLRFVCVIEDNQGHTTYTEPARAIITNEEENKPVLYVGEFALEPGDTLNLEDTPLGSGIVEYDANGVDITLTAVDANVKYPVFDSTLSPSMGLMFESQDEWQPEYRFHINGTCTIVNPYFDLSRNAAGVVFNSWFRCGDLESAEKPTIVLEGDGALMLVGGGNQYYSDANLKVDVDLKTISNAAVFCDGLRAGDIEITDGTRVQLGVNGTAIHTEGDLRVGQGAKLEIVSYGPHVSQGPTTKNIMFIVGSVYAKGADIDIRMVGDASQYRVYNSYLAVWYGIDLVGEGSLYLDNSRLSIAIESQRGIDTFGINWGGISGEGETNSVSLVNGSMVVVSGNLPNVMMANGIYVPGTLTVDENSSVQVDLHADGEVFGIVAESGLEVNDGSVTVQVGSLVDGKCYGIIAGGITLNLEKGGSVYSLAEGGLAIGADTGVVVTDGSGSGWVPDYKAEKLILGGKATIANPEKSGISPWGVPYMGNAKLVETVFDAGDTAKPAEEVLITSPGAPVASGQPSGGDTPADDKASGKGVNAGLVGWAFAAVAAIAAVFFAVRSGRKPEPAAAPKADVKPADPTEGDED